MGVAFAAEPSLSTSTLFFLFSMQYLACSSVLLALTSQAPALPTFSLHSIILSSWCVCGCVCMYVCRATKPFSLPRQPIPPSDPDCRDPAKPLSLPPSFLFFFLFFFLPACPCPCPCPKFSSFPLSGFTHFTHLTYLNIVIIPSPILALHTNRLLFFFFSSFLLTHSSSTTTTPRQFPFPFPSTYMLFSPMGVSACLQLVPFPPHSRGLPNTMQGGAAAILTCYPWPPVIDFSFFLLGFALFFLFYFSIPFIAQILPCVWQELLQTFLSERTPPVASLAAHLVARVIH